MEEKIQVQFSIEKNDKKYVFLMPGDGNLGEAYSAAYEMLLKLTEKMQEANKRVEPKKPEEAPAS